MTGTGGPSAWTDTGLPLEERVQAVVDDLDPQERTAVLLGDPEPLTRRGLPALSYVDSGTGLRGVDGATAFPAGIALAASFDPELAGEYGTAVGAEARAAGYSVVLGPTLDLARDPRAGRIPEALGEDPYLSGTLGAAHVRGLQSNHLISQVKHYTAYNGETRRTGYGLPGRRGDSMDVQVSPSVLHDWYLRPFRAAVAAGAWSLMGSYNRINGRYACENAELLEMPRSQWGWRGFYCPDFEFAVRDDALALEAGLDLPALGGAAGRTAAMVDPLPADRVAALVGNVVRALIGSGLADDPPPPPGEAGVPTHRGLAERAGVAGTVLLRNDGVLPLGPAVGSIALLGPSGLDALYVTGGSAAVEPGEDRLATPAGSLRARVGREVRLEVVQGSLGDVPLPVVPATAFSLPDGSGPGVEVGFTDPDRGAWTEVRESIDEVIDPAAGWPTRWRTRLLSDRTGPHRLSLSVGGSATVRIDGRVVMVGAREADRFIHGPRLPLQTVVELTAGVPVELEIDGHPGPAISVPALGMSPVLRLGWQQPDGLLDEAVAAAARCDVAIVLVNQAAGEGMDRDGLSLPGDQDELVRRVSAVNPRTVVVLNTPGAVLVPWADEVAAILQVWYPGETFGDALAAVLLGEAEPGGRLPLTFPLALDDLPGGGRDPVDPPSLTVYDDDGGIGYRAPGVAAHGCRFPFGHGLGYARTQATVTGVEALDGRLRITVRAVNHDDRETVHVAQVYATGPGRDVGELVALLRLPVPSLGSASGVVELGAEALARWNPESARYVPVAGRHLLRVAVSSADAGIPLAVEVADGLIVAARTAD